MNTRGGACPWLLGRWKMPFIIWNCCSKKGDYHGVLYDMENDVPVAVKNEMMGKISSIKGKINTLAARFSLDRRHRKARQLILSQLSCAWESLEETKTKRLKRYGDVDQELKELLDAELDTIIRMVLEMERLLWDDAQ